jgi:UDPglucose 6-dehydrogenase
MKLSFVNDIAALSNNLDANSKDVLHGLGLDHRIGNKFLTPGPGWGGSCFPKDVRALVNIADKEKVMMPLLSAAIKSNENAQDRVVDRITKELGKDLSTFKISALGVAFKANTDDYRNSPAVEIIKKITLKGGQVCAFDPVVKNISDIKLSESIEDALTDTDLIIVLTEWQDFSKLDPFIIGEIVKNKVALDTRNVLDKKFWNSAGFKFI